MAIAARHASQDYGRDWYLSVNDNGSRGTDIIQIILLQEIRDQLQRLNTLLNCPNFTNIPKTLRQIAKQTKRETPDALSSVRTESTSTRKRSST